VSVAGSVTLALESREHSIAEEEIKKSLKDKELLLREIHHRVKNNLQVVSSLLYLQSKKSSDKGVNDALLESQHRVKSMVLIHEKLYRSEDLASIDYSEYISELTNTLFRSYRLDTSRIKLELEVGAIRLNTDFAVQCGLLINELVSNAMKHAFPDERKGTISIKFKCDETEKYTLEIKDDGVGLKDDFTMDTRDTLGMQLVNTLVEQMNGTIEISNRNGAGFKIQFMLTK
jgi:two-component sensor histidine kinase